MNSNLDFEKFQRSKSNNAFNDLSRLNTNKQKATTESQKETPKKNEDALLNALLELGPNNKKPTKKEKKAARRQYKINNTIADLSVKSFGPTEAQLFDYVIHQIAMNHFSKNPNGSLTVNFSAEEYAKDSGLALTTKAGKRSDYPRRKLVRTLPAIIDLQFSTKDVKGDWIFHPFYKAHIARYNKHLGQTQVTIYADQDFFSWFQNYAYVTYYPEQMYKVEVSRSPLNYYLIRALADQKRINFGTPWADKIKIKTLLPRLSSLPTEFEVNTYYKGNFSQNVTSPILAAITSKDLRAVFSEIALISNDGLPLSIDTSIPWAVFKEATLVVKWRSYPESQVNKLVQNHKKHKITKKKK